MSEQTKDDRIAELEAQLAAAEATAAANAATDEAPALTVVADAPAAAVITPAETDRRPDDVATTVVGDPPATVEAEVGPPATITPAQTDRRPDDVAMVSTPGLEGLETEPDGAPAAAPVEPVVGELAAQVIDAAGKIEDVATTVSEHSGLLRQVIDKLTAIADRLGL